MELEKNEKKITTTVHRRKRRKLRWDKTNHKNAGNDKRLIVHKIS